MDDHKENLTYGASPLIFARATELKRTMTEAEKLLWKHLRNSKLNGHKFRRQHPIGQFIADFYCHEAKLVIEVDGEIHNEIEIQERDEGRTFMIENLGLKVIRFKNDEIKNHLTETLSKIKSNLQSSTPLS
jgi:very-short-patch-repair endonuclease